MKGPAVVGVANMSSMSSSQWGGSTQRRRLRGSAGDLEGPELNQSREYVGEEGVVDGAA